MQTQIFTSLSAADFRNLVADTVAEAVRNEIDRILESPSQPDKKYLTRKETALILGVSLPTLHQKTTTGEIAAYRLGSRVRYKATEIEKSLIQIKTQNRLK